eukprot:TRINITY_DN670_c0_g1_i1.p1 TRINITY_DN670_c0_g1~~TRINITY_DN670_c0_g1_i1.p1  ORF type:complete len:322 (+),score=85.61 TRINITY_DN670_c0_g1_i1:116-967(+)
MLRSLVGSEMCIRDRYQRRVRGTAQRTTMDEPARTHPSGPSPVWCDAAAQENRTHPQPAKDTLPEHDLARTHPSTASPVWCDPAAQEKNAPAPKESNAVPEHDLARTHPSTASPIWCDAALQEDRNTPAVPTSQTALRLKELGLVLPEPSAARACYVPVTRSGNLLFLAGHLPTPPGGELITGKVGKDLGTEEAAKAASYVALSLLATVQAELGDLDQLKKVVKLVGFVNCTDQFTEQHLVMNGASELIGQVLGDRGVHARSAVGTNSLPLNIPVEIEAIVEF